MSRFVHRPVCGLALLFGLMLTGCGSSNPMTKTNYDKIQEGMTMEEVATIMGFPKETSETGSLARLKADSIQTANDVERFTRFTEDGHSYDEFKYKELGGTNKKEIYVTYYENKVITKQQVGIE
jgi:hypothetical protein